MRTLIAEQLQSIKTPLLLVIYFESNIDRVNSVALRIDCDAVT